MGPDSPWFLGFFSLILPIWLLSSSSSSQAYTFDVGGKDGWVTEPSEDYQHWSHRNRFQVNDTLRFRYKKGSDSVMEVKKEDYDSCNTQSPIKKMEDGDSSLRFDRSGPFYFISGKAENCQKGQKLNLVVMAVRNETRRQSPPPSSPGADSPKAESPGNGPTHPSHEASAPSPSGSDSIVRVGVMGVALGVISIGVNLIFSGIGGVV